MTRGISTGALITGAALLGVGCGPFLTPIPTYWDPVLRERPELPPPPAEVEATVGAEFETPTPIPSDPEPDEDFEVEEAPQECNAIYLVTAENNIVAYQPQQNTFEVRGHLNCPVPSWATPFSMAVDTEGTAQVLLQNGQIVEVSLADASCKLTPYKPGQHGFYLFGMGYAKHGAGESLYVTHIPASGPSAGLARLDTDGWKLEPVSRYHESPGSSMELTPTGDGPLYGYAFNHDGRGGTLLQIDGTTAKFTERTPLRAGTGSSSLAVAWWGGRFFIFTGEAGFRRGSKVHRYDPDSNETKVVALHPQTIVGAGVSTCAPDRKR